MSTPVTCHVTLSAITPSTLPIGKGLHGGKTIQLIKATNGAPVPAQTGVIKHLYQIIKGPNGRFQVEGLKPGQQTIRQIPDGQTIPTRQRVPLRVASPSASAFSVGDAVKFLPHFAKKKALSYLPSLGLDEAVRKVLSININKDCHINIDYIFFALQRL